MMDISKQDDTEIIEAEATVMRAMTAFRRAVAALEGACDLLEADATVGEREVLKDLKVMNAAYLFALQVKEKARDAGQDHVGRVGGGELDLEAARAEIGLRLACLRDAGGGGGVSGEFE